MKRNNVLVLAAILLSFCLVFGCGDNLVSSPGNLYDGYNGGGSNCAWREKTWSCNDDIQRLSERNVAKNGGIANEKK